MDVEKHHIRFFGGHLNGRLFRGDSPDPQERSQTQVYLIVAQHGQFDYVFTVEWSNKDKQKFQDLYKVVGHLPQDDGLPTIITCIYVGQKMRGPIPFVAGGWEGSHAVECRSESLPLTINKAIDADGKRTDEKAFERFDVYELCYVFKETRRVEEPVKPEKGPDIPFPWDIKKLGFKFIGGGVKDGMIARGDSPKHDEVQDAAFFMVSSEGGTIGKGFLFHGNENSGREFAIRRSTGQPITPVQTHKYLITKRETDDDGFLMITCQFVQSM